MYKKPVSFSAKLSVSSCFYLTPATLAMCGGDLLRTTKGDTEWWSVQVFYIDKEVARVGTFSTDVEALADCARYGLKMRKEIRNGAIGTN